MKQHTLVGPDAQPFRSTTPGTLGGHRRDRIYGRLDCAGAARALARGGYVADRVFFADAPTAIAAGYRPCATCLPAAYATFKEHRAMPLAHTVVATPIGDVVLLADHEGLCEIRFDARDVPAGSPRVDTGLLGEAARQLRGYAEGLRETFDLPLRPRSGTRFQRAVWDHVAAIPFGTTTTYGEIADALGVGGAGARAVGAANGANPLPIVVPCHRVIGARGALTGYAGGLDRKRALLAHEGALLAV
jgi:methylated-DNA-[protein]-cysteine S-methyltransferase